MINRRRVVAFTATLALGPTLTRRALAEAWPARPVRIVVPFAPGGSTDSVARITADQLSRIWGQQAVIENKPGAATNIAAAAVAGANPDGYTILMATTSLAISRLSLAALRHLRSCAGHACMHVSPAHGGAELIASEIAR
jgi:tripartite-type tricarboxylate transporter receptor subunit TctC